MPPYGFAPSACFRWVQRSPFSPYDGALLLEGRSPRARALKEIEDVDAILEPFKGSFDRFSGQLGIEPQRKLEGADNPGDVILANPTSRSSQEAWMQTIARC